MTHWGVGARLLSCASMFVLASTAWAHPSSSSCQSITHPTTINHDKKCVTVKKTINGDVVNNAKVGRHQNYHHDEKPGFFIGNGGLIKGKLVNNGGIFGGEKGMGALTLGDAADVKGGIFNKGVIASDDGSGISLGYHEHGWHGGPQAAQLTGDIVNSGLIYGDDYGVAARYGTMSGTLINTSYGVIIGGDVGVYIPDSFTSWSGGIENSGLIYGDTSGIQIGGSNGGWGGEGGEHGGEGGEYSTFTYDDSGGVVFSGGIFNYAGGAIISKSGPSIAIGGASFSGGVYNDGLITQYPGYGGDGYGHYGYYSDGYQSPYKGVGIVFTAETVEGGLFNDVNGEIYGTKGPAVWITDRTESFSGGIANLGTIAGANDGIRIESATFAGGFSNSGSIVASYGDGVFASSAWSGTFTNLGLISGAQNGFAYVGSTFDGDFGNAGVIEGGNVAVLMSGQTLDGAFTNTGAISGGATGVSLNFDTITGGFTNSGTIAGAWGDGVAITVGTWGAADARADIVNAGTITGAETGFLLDAGTVYGDFINNGQITGNGENTGVHIIADQFVGDIVNNEAIASPYDALVTDIDKFDGSFANTGNITGGANGAVLILGEMTGDFTNSGSISGAWGNGVDITVDTWGSAISPVAVANTVDGVITGGDTGFALDAGALHGAFTNEGTIEGSTTGASFAADTFDAPFANAGSISGGVDGVVMVLGQATGGFTNSGSISGAWGDGVAITVGSWGAADARADIVNAATGAITGGATGFLLDAGTVYGDFINNGQITGNGENTGVHIIADQFFGDIVNNEAIGSPYDALVADIDVFDGNFANTGNVAGGANGAVLILGEMTGDFTNSGSISGAWGNGVDITVDTWGSAISPVAITNTADGVISGGETGFALDAGTVHGAFTNAGTIEGGTTGASFAADTFDAPFANSGSINGGVDGVVMVLGQAAGGFTNSGAIGGETGNGVDIVVTSWGTESARADIVNTTSGTITGGASGFALELVTMHGDVTNDGLIEGGGIAVLMSGGTFDGAFTNTGDIDGGATGVALNLTNVTGAFSNSGSINGGSGDGVAITVETWGAADARADIVNTASGTITGGDTGFLLDAGTVYGDFINNGQITGNGENTGVHIIADTFVGDIVNNQSIDSAYDALVADIDTFDGAFSNTGNIAGGANGAVLVLGEMTGGFTNSGSISGAWANGVDITVDTWGSVASPVGILNTVDGVVTGGQTGFVLDAGTLHGAFTNVGLIEGGTTGASFAVDTFDAPFANSGTINGGADGVVMVFGQATGGFSNSGSIDGASGNGVDILVTNWGTAEARANIVNTASGTIGGGANGFALELATMHGDVTNDGLIEGGNIAVLMSGGTFDGAFTNTGDIDGGATGVALNLSTVTGAFTNSGSIGGVSGDGVALTVGTWGAADARADIVNTATGTITGGDTGFLIDAGTVYGDFINNGQITGNGENTGVHIIADTFAGDVVNNEQISSPYDALVVDVELLDGAFINTGAIAGGASGAVFVLGQMTGDFTNSNSIGGETGDGVAITVETWGSTITPVDIVNTLDGSISGGETGFALDAGALHGAFTNAGTIEGGTTGASFAADTFDAPFANSGGIAGGVDGVVMVLGQATGGFSNSGSIGGASGNGVDIVVTTWGTAEARADIVNTATGVITGGDTGFLLDAGTVYGDFINDGQITGNGESTGVHIIAETFVGDVVNNDELDAPSNALHLEIGTLDGEVVNTGTITASAPNGVAVALEIGNGATFTNTGGGLIIGDVVFAGDAAYHFVAEDGGIDGDLIGEGDEGNDDTITVQNGTHTFTGGTASNFASFVVADGATAMMGALFEGDVASSGYAFSNVDNLTVSNGGTLYIGQSTTLVVDNNFTQQAGGTLEFYLGAPGGADFSDLTGSVVAGDGDYGQIVVNGTVTLDGAVVGFLDPAFADANPGLDQVLYNDVIVANGGISGDFSTVALIADSSLFELNDIIDGNTVDMQVTRTSLNVGDLSGIIVNTGGPFDAMVSDRSNGLGSGSCGLAGDGWCFNRFAANAPGATQVMTDASPQDPFAWLRTGVRKEGETAVWGRAIGVFGETDGHAGSLGTDFRVGGAIAGIDHNFSPTMMAGLAAQWTTTDVDFKGRPDSAEVESFEAGAYMSYGDTRLYLNANASVIWHEVDVNRFTPNGQSFGEYDGTTLSAFAEVGKTFETPEVRIQPFLALSYSHLETNDYSETGTGTRLNISGSEFDSLKSIIGARLAYPIEMDSGRKVVPEFRLAWAHEFMDDQASFVATIQGQQPVPTIVRGEKFSRDTVVVGAGVTVPLSDSAAVFVDYDGGLNNDITTHTVSAGIRITW